MPPCLRMEDFNTPNTQVCLMAIVQSFDENKSPFDSILHIDRNGNEFWYARELMPMLGYQKWERFAGSIDRAKIACQNSGNVVTDHFFPEAGKSLTKPKDDFRLSRLACYLIAMNGDPRKSEIAMAQSYFAVKTREAETVIPVLASENETLRLMLELERERNRGKELDNTMLQIHGDRVVLALRGLSNQVIEKETVVTEVVDRQSGTSTKILSADQLKKAVKDRTGQKLPSQKFFIDALRKAGRDDLVMPVNRPMVAEYVIPDRLDEAISVVYGDRRQRLLGE